MTADEMDLAAEREEIARSAAIAATGREIPPGVAGECDYCGNEWPRLIRGACARCRDERRLK